MSKYLNKLYEKYISSKEEHEPLSITNSFIIGDFGEICLGDNFIFLLTGTSGRFATGYKVSEWTDFATSEDFIFGFNGQKWLAILEHELWVPMEKLKTIGMMEEKDLDIFYEFDVNGVDLPSTHTGLTIPMDDDNYPQVKFREAEMAEVSEYIFAQFTALEELENSLIDLETFKSTFKEKLKTMSFPKAAASSLNTARGDNFTLFYERGILKMKVDSEIAGERFLRISIDGDEFCVILENRTIEIDILDDYFPLEYIANKIRIRHA